MKHKAEIFDQLQYLYDTTGFNDHQLHGTLYFENHLNAPILQKAVEALTEVLPILSRVYRNHGSASCWEDTDTFNKAELFETVSTKEAFDHFTFSKTNAETGPQIKVCLLQGDRDAVSIVMNHMVCDGAGFKQCLYLLAEIYSRLLENPDDLPKFQLDGDRSFRPIVGDISFLQRVKILLFGGKDNNQRSTALFPMDNSAKTEPFIVVHPLPPEIYKNIRTFCKAQNATVNDLLLTAYFRALSKLLGIYGQSLSVPIMIDMRRYLEDKTFYAPTNLSSTAAVTVSVAPDEDFIGTLCKVKNEMRIKKSGLIGMSPFIKLDVLYRVFIKTSFNKLQNGLRNPNICMTNIGILDSEKLLFKGSPLLDAIVCGSIKYRPHFQMSVSTYRDKMTLCANLYGSNKDRETIEQFFALMDESLMQIPPAPSATHTA